VEKRRVFRQFDVLQLQEVGDFTTELQNGELHFKYTINCLWNTKPRQFFVGAVKGWRIIATLFYDSLLCCFASVNLSSYSSKHLTLSSENEFLGRV
jgi:hypothetical protein